jgi:four helix bundle protein
VNDVIVDVDVIVHVRSRSSLRVEHSSARPVPHSSTANGSIASASQWSSRPRRPISVRERRLGALRDQLDRASVSVVLNIAEGAGRRTAADKAHFFTIARGSPTECAVVLELLALRCLLAPQPHRHGRSLLVRIVQTLTRLITRQALP